MTNEQLVEIGAANLEYIEKEKEKEYFEKLKNKIEKIKNFIFDPARTEVEKLEITYCLINYDDEYACNTISEINID